MIPADLSRDNYMPIYLGDFTLKKGDTQIFQGLLHKGYGLTMLFRDVMCHNGPLFRVEAYSG